MAQQLAEKFQVIFEKPKKNQPISEHQAFVQQAEDLYQQFLKAQTYETAAQVADQLVHHVQTHYPFVRQPEPRHDEKKANNDFEVKFRHEFNLLLEYLMREMQRRFQIAAMQDQLRREAEAQLLAQKEKKAEAQQELYAGYAAADRAERERAESHVRAPIVTIPTPRPVPAFTIPEEAQVMLRKVIHDIEEDIEKLMEELGVELNAENLAPEAMEGEVFELRNVFARQFANDAVRYDPETEQNFIGPLLEETIKHQAEIEACVAQPHKDENQKEYMMMKLYEATNIETSEQWDKVRTHTKTAVLEELTPPTQAPSFSH